MNGKGSQRRSRENTIKFEQEYNRIFNKNGRAPIKGFFGCYRFLSNFHMSTFVYDPPFRNEKIAWPSVEHAYQALKCDDPVIWRKFAAFEKPGQARREGQLLTMRPNWENLKFDLMKVLVTEKFKDPELAKLLVATEDAYLEETNKWGDRYWGVCEEAGLNRLGEILMEVRSKLAK